MHCRFAVTLLRNQPPLFLHRCEVCGYELKLARSMFVRVCAGAPTITERATSALVAHTQWALAGFPLRPAAEQRQLFTICQACPRYESDGDEQGWCLECGCRLRADTYLFNKIALATAHCPLGKW